MTYSTTQTRPPLWLAALVAPTLSLAATLLLAILGSEVGPLYLAGPAIAPATVVLHADRVGVASNVRSRALLSLAIAALLAAAATWFLSGIPSLD